MAHRYAKSILLPYTADELFAVAADVKAYPRFLPWVRDMRVRSEPRGGETESFVAEASIGYKAIAERFVTRVWPDRVNRRINVALIDGPFKSLAADWRFFPAGAGSRTEFAIEYRFKNPILQALLSAAFEPIVARIIEAFVAEAHRRYAKPAGEPGEIAPAGA